MGAGPRCSFVERSGRLNRVGAHLNATLNDVLNEVAGRPQQHVDGRVRASTDGALVAFAVNGALFHDNPSLEEHTLPIKLTFTVQEAADLLGVSRSTAYECVHLGDLPALTLGRRLLVTRATLESMLGALPDPVGGADARS